MGKQSRMWCETKITTRPAINGPLRQFFVMCAAVCASTADRISSRRIYVALEYTARARHTRALWPPERTKPKQQLARAFLFLGKPTFLAYLSLMPLLKSSKVRKQSTYIQNCAIPYSNMWETKQYADDEAFIRYVIE